MIETQKLLEGEKIEKIIKGHNVYFYKLIFQFIFFLVILIGSYIYFQKSTYVIFISIITLQLFLVYVYKKIMNYEFNKLILTNQRIMGFFRVSFFEYEFFEMNLSEIAQIQGKTQGFFSNHFGYGNLEITIKGKEKSFCIHQAKDIIKNAQCIQKTLLEYKKVK